MIFCAYVILVSSYMISATSYRTWENLVSLRWYDYSFRFFQLSQFGQIHSQQEKEELSNLTPVLAHLL